MQTPFFIQPNTTKALILEAYPVGSEVDREDIGNAYILLSKSDKQIINKRGKGKEKAPLSIRASRRRKGVRFFKRMVKLGFWKDKSTLHPVTQFLEPATSNS